MGIVTGQSRSSLFVPFGCSVDFLLPTPGVGYILYDANGLPVFVLTQGPSRRCGQSQSRNEGLPACSFASGAVRNGPAV